VRPTTDDARQHFPNPETMAVLLRIARGIDRTNELVGTAVSWLAVLMVLIGAYNAIVRYLGRYIGFNLSSNAYIEMQWYLFSLLFLLGAAWTLKQDAHVRVDVFYARVSDRARSWINVVGSVLFLIPFCVFVLWVSWPAVRNSWQVREVSPDPGGLVRWPLKAVILVAFVLLLLQALSELVKEIERLRQGAPREAEPHGEGV
jgi:TRAP-type mannitol/chloroaromatic compound transport system permease small subunit